MAAPAKLAPPAFWFFPLPPVGAGADPAALLPPALEAAAPESVGRRSEAPALGTATPEDAERLSEPPALGAAAPENPEQCLHKCSEPPALVAAAPENAERRSGPAAPPDPDGAAARAAGFAALEARVARAKAQLDAIPPGDFAVLARGLDLHHGLPAALRAEYGLQAPTNAALKALELYAELGLLAPGARVRAFFNAELPGAFLAAAQHWVRAWCPGATFDWVAASLWPENGPRRGPSTGAAGALGDAFGLYAGNRDRWLMGPRPNALPAGAPETDGDLTAPAAVAALAAGARARFAPAPGLGAPHAGATLYVADAGADASADYGGQEARGARLAFGQVLCGLLALAPGGALVAKLYAFAAPFTRSLVGLVAALFDAAALAKPRASRPANSEVYLVGRGFRGLGAAHAAALLGRLAAYAAPGAPGPCAAPPLLAPALTAALDAALLAAGAEVHGRRQVAFLDEMAAAYGRYRGNLARLAGDLRPVAARARAAWVAATPLRPLRPEFALAARPPAPRRGAKPRAGPRPGGHRAEGRAGRRGGS